jgi:hypothetical protein
MAKKKSSGDETWGPFYDTYIKGDYEQETPAYREVTTPHGTFGIPPGQVLHFEDVADKDDPEVKIPQPVWEDDPKAKLKKPKKVGGASEVEEA